MISILTININKQSRYKELKLLQQLIKNNINDNDFPDLIFTQENDESFFKSNDKFNNSIYKIFTSYGIGCEEIGVYYNINKIKNANKNLKIIKTCESTYNGDNNYLPFMRRYGIIIEYKGIKIANIHLEGGRFSDFNLTSVDNIKLMLNYKLDLLNKILLDTPDIILGDFNSQYYIDNFELNKTNTKIIFKNNIDNTRFNYFKEYINKYILYDEELTIELKYMLLFYNHYPHMFLKQLGYNICCNNIDIINTTSIGNSVVDCIYYNKKIIPINGKIIDCGDNMNGKYFGNISDHNPVYLKFNLENNI
jgi:endonuclease/exonuclease/phosphatase family metal-dependent hydrolase